MALLLAVGFAACSVTPPAPSPTVTSVATGYVNPDYAAGLVYKHLEQYGPFADADAKAVATFSEAFKTFADKVVGMSSASSGVEVYIIAGNTELNSSAINDIIKREAQKRADALGKKLSVRCIVKLGAIILAGSDDDLGEIGKVCDAVFIGQIHD